MLVLLGSPVLLLEMFIGQYWGTVQCTHFVLLYVGTAKRPRTAARNVSLNIEHFVNSTLFIGFTLFIVHFV